MSYVLSLAEYYGADIRPMMSGITNMAADLIETAMKNGVLTKFTDAKLGFLATGFDLAELLLDNRLKNSGIPPNSLVFAELKDELQDLADSMHGGLIAGMGATLAQYTESLYRTQNLVKAYKDVKFTVGVLPFVTRQYLQEFFPNEPVAEMAFRMERHGVLNRAEFGQYAEHQGWGPVWLDKLFKTFTTTPDLFLSFSMFKRGIIDNGALVRNIKAHGYDDTDLLKVRSALYRTPSLGELTRISDFVELSGTYLSEKLRFDGYTDGDIPLLVSALLKRPNREEIRGMTTELVWMYQHGRISLDDLGTAFDEIGLLPTEKALDTQRSELQYAQQLIQEGLQVVEYMVEYGEPSVQTLDDIKTAIEDLGINEETANLLAAQYYYHYVYVHP